MYKWDDRNGNEAGTILTEYDVKCIRRLWNTQPNITRKQLAKLYKVSYDGMRNIIKGKRWKYLPVLASHPDRRGSVANSSHYCN